MKLDVVLAPTLLEEHDLAGCVCAVIDVLRATSTIVAALAAGAVAVYPFPDAEAARRGAAAHRREPCLLGGEEKGKHIPGFDLGNSPLEYSPEAVAGKAIFFYTTNGTGAILGAYAGCGQPVHICALLNISAACSAVAGAASAQRAGGIVIVCSGRYGRPSAEDLLCSGLVVERVASQLREAGIAPEMGDGASIAAGFAAGSGHRVAEVVANSEHGRFLQSIGFAPDLDFAARLDLYHVVPVFDGERAVLPTSGL